MKYVVVFERSEDNWSAYVPDLPGCVTTGNTFEETKERIREAIEFHIEAHAESNAPLPCHSCVDAAVVEVDVPDDALFGEAQYPLSGDESDGLQETLAGSGILTLPSDGSEDDDIMPRTWMSILEQTGMLQLGKPSH